MLTKNNNLLWAKYKVQFGSSRI